MCEKKERNKVRFSDLADSINDVTPEMADAAYDALFDCDWIRTNLEDDWPETARAIFVAMCEAKKKQA